MKRIQDRREIARCLEASGFGALFSAPVEDRVELYRAERGDVILREGAPSDGRLYRLVSGRVKLTCSLSNGRTSLLYFFEKGDLIGEMELLGKRSRTMGVRALAPCLLLALPFEGQREALLEDRRFLRALSTELADKERRLTAHLMQTQGFPLKNRLAQFILLCAHDGVYEELNTDASAYLGTSYRHLTQTFREFVGQGLLEKAPGGYRVADRGALGRLAEEMEVGW